MEYFDSDVIFNFLVVQDVEKHEKARELIFKAINASRFVVSTLSIQEVRYGLARYGIANEEIKSKLEFLTSLRLVEVTLKDVLRAMNLARHIGFKHINDCIHTALAESLSLNKFYTYNRSDFKRIQKYSKLNILILE